MFDYTTKVFSDNIFLSGPLHFNFDYDIIRTFGGFSPLCSESDFIPWKGKELKMPVVEKKRITPRTQTLRKRVETREEKMISALSPNLNVMVNAVRKVGQNIVHDFREVANLQISEKGPGDFVSNADLFSEKKLIELLREARPGYGFLSEECGEIPAAEGCDYYFVMDPIDGTNNFIHAIPLFCISLALMQKDKVVAGDWQYVTDKCKEALGYVAKARA